MMPSHAPPAVVAPPDPPEAPRPRTLREILSVLQEADEAMIDITAEELAAIGVELGDKVDAIKYVIDKLEGEAKRFAGYIEDFQKAKRVVENNAASLKTMVARYMAEGQFERLAGVKFQARLGSSESVETLQDPDANLYRKMREFIRPSYSWDKVALKNALKSSKASIVAPYASIVEKPWVTFDPKKEGRNNK